MRFSARFSAMILVLAFPMVVHAADGDSSSDKPSKKKSKAAKADASAVADPNQAGEMLEVEKVKEKYWAQGQDAKMGVVQNRLYSKENKFELGVLGGVSIADPFLSNKNLGGTLGYHFNEFLGAELVGWKTFSDPSSALKTAVAAGKNFNTVEPRWFMGAEGLASIMYGKLSLLGRKILYYDMHLIGGLGVTSEDHHKVIDSLPPALGGENDLLKFTGILGLGQRFYVAQSWSLRLDYRVQMYNDTIQERVDDAHLGETVGHRAVFAHDISFGVSYMFDVIGKK